MNQNTQRGERDQSGDALTAPVVPRRPFVNGRVLAYAVLQEFDRSDRFIQDIFADFESRHRLSPADRALAVDVASGVVRRLRTLDVLIESRLTRPRHNVEPDLWRVLRVGVQQLVFSRTPDHAAVDSTVELCRLLGRDRWTGFVNGILRSVGRMLTDQEIDAPSQSSVPLVSGRWRVLNAPVFPDPTRALPEFIASAFSLPDELAARWCRRMESHDLLTTCFHSVTPPATTLRVNQLRSTRDQMLRAFEAADVPCRPGANGSSVLLETFARLESLPGYSNGLWSVQDEAAMVASELMAPQPGERILDLCAAPGGKSTHLAELSRDQAVIFACDVARNRLQRIAENAGRLQLDSLRAVLIGKDGSGIPDGPFDAVLVDVPCSNTGVLNRRPEARWRCTEQSLRELALLQHDLLRIACERVSPGGRVVYSTCSLEPEENRSVVDAVLAERPDMHLESDRLHLPGQPSDGAYQALLRRD